MDRERAVIIERGVAGIDDIIRIRHEVFFIVISRDQPEWVDLGLLVRRRIANILAGAVEIVRQVLAEAVSVRPCLPEP